MRKTFPVHRMTDFVGTLRRCGGALHFGEGSAHADAGGEEGSLDLLALDIEEGGNAIRIVAFDVAQQEDHALIGGQFFERLFHFGALDITSTEMLTGNGFYRLGLLVEGHALAKLIHQSAVHAAAIRLLGLTESADEGVPRDLFRLDLVPHHVISDGVSAMLMGLIDVALPVLERPLGHLALHDPA
jgi:hypothetical protein